MQSEAKLIYLSSDHIQQAVADNPVCWTDLAMAQLGGAGDRAGMTPTPAVLEFLELIGHQKRMVSASEYVEHCFMQRWTEWLDTKPEELRQGVEAKLRCNFYPSMAATLHAWALLVETGGFEQCWLDTYDDVVANTDLTLVRFGTTYRIELIGPRARSTREYKVRHRQRGDPGTVVQIPFSRAREPGNMRWYRMSDFREFIDTAVSVSDPEADAFFQRAGL